MRRNGRLDAFFNLLVRQAQTRWRKRRPTHKHLWIAPPKRKRPTTLPSEQRKMRLRRIFEKNTPRKTQDVLKLWLWLLHFQPRTVGCWKRILQKSVIFEWFRSRLQCPWLRSPAKKFLHASGRFPPSFCFGGQFCVVLPSPLRFVEFPLPLFVP